jgi:hypothetical protein
MTSKKTTLSVMSKEEKNIVFGFLMLTYEDVVKGKEILKKAIKRLEENEDRRTRLRTKTKITC